MEAACCQEMPSMWRKFKNGRVFFRMTPQCTGRRNPNRNKDRDVSGPFYNTLREAQVTKSHKRTYTTTRRQRRANKSSPSRRTRFRVPTPLRETILHIYGKARNSKTFSKIRIHSKHLPAARKHSQYQHLDTPAAIPRFFAVPDRERAADSTPAAKGENERERFIHRPTTPRARRA